MKRLPLLLSILACVAFAAPTGCATSDNARDRADAPRPTSGPARDIGATPRAVERDPDDPLAAPADVAAPPTDAIWTASGLASKVLTEGTGTARPRARDTVVVHYTGWKIDGTRFDSSVARGEPAVFPLNRVIPGWTEGLQLMVVGEKRRLWIPAELAYGSSPREGAPAGPLVFDVELLGIQ